MSNGLVKYENCVTLLIRGGGGGNIARNFYFPLVGNIHAFNYTLLWKGNLHELVMYMFTLSSNNICNTVQIYT